MGNGSNGKYLLCLCEVHATHPEVYEPACLLKEGQQGALAYESLFVNALLAAAASRGICDPADHKGFGQGEAKHRRPEGMGLSHMARTAWICECHGRLEQGKRDDQQNSFSVANGMSLLQSRRRTRNTNSD